MLKIFALSLILICGTAYASEPPAPVPAKASQFQSLYTTQAGQQHAAVVNAPVPVIIKSPITVEKSKADLNQERQESNKESSSEGWMIAFTGMLTVATIALAISTGFLWHETRKSADAAERAIGTTRDAYIASERPWISVEAKIDSDLVRNGRSVEFAMLFTVKNHGKSPATNVRVHYDVVTLKIEPDQFADVRRRIEQMRDIPGIGENMGINVFPGEQKPIRWKVPLSEAEIDAGHTPRTGFLPSFYAIGSVFYQSPLGEEVFQTGFNYYILDNRNPGGSDLPDFTGPFPARCVSLIAQSYKKGTIV